MRAFIRKTGQIAVVMIVLVGSVIGGIGTAQAVSVLPPVNAQFDYQIGGAYTPSASVGVVSRDRTASPVPGKYNICYVNAFQTQPDDETTWSGRNDDLILRDASGKKVGDPEWNEYLLDTSSNAKRTRIAAIVNGWIDECASKGFNAVEPDNLDSFTRSKRLLTKANNVALATSLAAHAHEKGLAIAQKNTTELGSTGKTSVGFDFAIAEECQYYGECSAYTSVYGKNVIEIEYTDNPRSAYSNACSAQGKNISVILRDRDVVTPGNSAYHYEHC
ncbi:endo alpha-1,4 polygalactosaminidase [Saxibacter everestensis]|uniref:Endo alpha-1,4 polygalactosaminidase n=1 Tax=Saxibacter everestensis TaxID=2909229 RepID=A0ABY8QVR2_9MICO|nr:endo alpha-1,4 polygalactosaminidase [Brevibacteriaceae bacterium ZFBP1038]